MTSFKHIFSLFFLLLFVSVVQVSQAQPRRRSGPRVIRPPRPEERPAPPEPEPQDEIEPPINLPSPSPSAIQCTSPFRSLDGTCTSAVNSQLGATRRPQFSYGTPLDASSPTGSDRPSARLISNMVCAQSDNILSGRNLNELVTFMGQFLDHNFILTTVNRDEKFDIEIPRTDPIFANFSGGVLRFERSTRARDGSGRLRPVNDLSSAIDLVAVYGPSEERLRALRRNRDGLMRTSRGNLLPLNRQGIENAPAPTRDFFIAGDIRANENPVLTAVHTLFVREHNKIARELRELFPRWSNERLFQNARLVNTAQFQKIIYEEFYPQMTGRRLPRYQGYRPSVDPTVSDVFGAMAFRIGHTMVGNQINRRGVGNSMQSPIPFTEMFFRRNSILNNGIEPFIRGAMSMRSQEVDVFVVNALRNFLFTNVPQEVGFDLMALNIQRGRDHALPTYNQLRQIFGRRPARNFRQISSNRAVQNALSSAYGGNIDRVDGIVGLFAEDHIPRASMGRTMFNIWREEFSRLRDGDRLFYLRRQAYPRVLRQRYPRVNRIIRDRNDQTFRRLILDNTDIVEGELGDSVWRASA